MEHCVNDITHLLVSLMFQHLVRRLTGRSDSGNLVNGFKATKSTATQFRVGENPGVFAKSLLT